jgi:uncharacterized protein (DUF305 family)
MSRNLRMNKFRHQKSSAVRFWILAFGMSAALGGGMTACTTNSKSQAQNSNPTQNMNHGNMQHGGMMDHSSMDLGPADADYDLRFIDSMIPHHQGAIVMAKEVLQKSKRPELQKLAKEIIAAQTKEITQMTVWRKEWYPKASNEPMMWHASAKHMMAMTPEHKQGMMMSMDLGAADPEFDQRFIDAMIPHHQGAVVMAKDLLQKSKRPELQKLAKDIIAAQQAEIQQMQSWKKSWYPK